MTTEKMTVEFVYQNAINDIFKIVKNGVVEYEQFPRTMGMTAKDVKEYFDKS